MVSYGYSYAAGFLVGAAAVTYLVGWPWAIPFYILAAFCLELLPRSGTPDATRPGSHLPRRR